MRGIATAVLAAVVGLIVAAIGAPLVFWGAQLAISGGSHYYLLAGLALVLAGLLIGLGQRIGYWVVLAITAATVPWALWETGGERWGMVARLVAPAILALLLTPLAITLRPAGFERGRVRPRSLWAGFAAGIAALAVFTLAISDRAPDATASDAMVAAAARSDWPGYGGDWRGDHYTALAQITPTNAPSLERAWAFRTGGLGDLGANSRFTASPIAIGDKLFFCDPRNRVFAIDGTTGREVWRHDPKVDASKAFSIVCRGVSYARSPDGPCPERILVATLDARMLALDAANGAPCPGFGRDGAISLLDGVAQSFDGYYYGTSPPTVIGDVAVVGGYVIDNQRLDPARSVVRAFDVRTGALRWAWDAGAATAGKGADGLYSAGNPNAWAPFSADPALGLVYVPTGNSSPDFFGALRTPAAERFGTSIVALDVRSGAVRWSFQTVHHDLWDYDMPAQPALVDVRGPGGAVPALIATGKTGQVFVLDRRTGAPVHRVAERAVPRSPLPDERSAPTQPYSVDMPHFAPARLTERMMWGATPIDQMMCRLQFHRMRYEGDYTPPSLQPFLFSPGTFGAINWGGVAIDRARGLLLVNASNMPFVGSLVPRAEADKAGAAPFQAGAPRKPAEGRVPMMAMAGTPYALRLAPFLSPLGFPCLAPPWGEIAAVDIASGKTRWRRPFGSTRGLAPLGLQLPVGTFNLGGAVTTAGGVTFIAAATDGWMRAIETGTGRELWRDALPAGGQATPLSYTARDGRQMIAIVAGGHGSLRTPRGDWLIAYALPRSMIKESAR